MTAHQILRKLLTLVLLLPLPAAAGEVIELIPEERASFNSSNVFAPVTGLFMGGPGYWYATRQIEVETVPPGAVLDLFYVRASFQKAYEQAESPVTILLPSRVEAGKRDSVTIRALLDGFRQQEVRVKMRSRQSKVVIELSPLPNVLLAVSHTYFAGRGSLAFLTKEPLNFRVQKGGGVFSVVLTETGADEAAQAAIEGASSPLLRSLQAQQLGEDLVVRVAVTESAAGDKVDIRSRQAFDAVRDVHIFALDFVPADGGAEAVQRAKAALVRVRTEDVTGCALAYGSALREQLEAADLSRALAPNGSFTDPYLREAMKRLGQLSPDGVITLTDGSRFHAEAPIELMAAASQSAEVIGYLAMLRSFVAELEPPESRHQTLRGLIAPELAAARFEAITAAAESREEICRASAGLPDPAEQL
jgi:hypothetical protein